MLLRLSLCTSHNPKEVTDKSGFSTHGGRDGIVVRVLGRFNSQIRRHMWIEFVGSLLCSERFFSAYSGFLLSSKTLFDLTSITCSAPALKYTLHRVIIIQM